MATPLTMKSEQSALNVGPPWKISDVAFGADAFSSLFCKTDQRNMAGALHRYGQLALMTQAIA